MKLKAPYTGGIVDAQGDQVEWLKSKGYTPVEPPKKPTRKRTTAKKE